MNCAFCDTPNTETAHYCKACGRSFSGFDAAMRQYRLLYWFIVFLVLNALTVFIGIRHFSFAGSGLYYFFFAAVSVCNFFLPLLLAIRLTYRPLRVLFAVLFVLRIIFRFVTILEIQHWI